jgi:hypothetical protein
MSQPSRDNARSRARERAAALTAKSNSAGYRSSRWNSAWCYPVSPNLSSPPTKSSLSTGATVKPGGTAGNDTYIVTKSSAVRVGAQQELDPITGNSLDISALGGLDEIQFTEPWDATSVKVDGGNDRDTIDLSKLDKDVTVKFAANGTIARIEVGKQAELKSLGTVTAIEVVTGGKKGNVIDLSAYNGGALMISINKSAGTDNEVVVNALTITPDPAIPDLLGEELITVVGVTDIIGGRGNDRFVFADGAELEGSIDGGLGDNTVDYAAKRQNIKVDLATGQATFPRGSVMNVQHIIGAPGKSAILVSGLPGNLRYRVGDSKFTNVLTGTDGDNRLSGGTPVTLQRLGLAIPRPSRTPIIDR